MTGTAGTVGNHQRREAAGKEKPAVVRIGRRQVAGRPALGQEYQG